MASVNFLELDACVKLACIMLSRSCRYCSQGSAADEAAAFFKRSISGDMSQESVQNKVCCVCENASNKTCTQCVTRHVHDNSLRAETP